MRWRFDYGIRPIRIPVRKYHVKGVDRALHEGPNGTVAEMTPTALAGRQRVVTRRTTIVKSVGPRTPCDLLVAFAADRRGPYGSCRLVAVAVVS